MEKVFLREAEVSLRFYKGISLSVELGSFAHGREFNFYKLAADHIDGHVGMPSPESLEQLADAERVLSRVIKKIQRARKAIDSERH